MRFLCVCLLLISYPALSAAPPSPAGPLPAAQTAQRAMQHNAALRVGVREVPPFSWKDESGDWHGLSVDVWMNVAERLNLPFEWREVELTDTWPALEGGRIDAAISALSITADREALVDFSHPYLVSGLSPAYRADGGSGWWTTVENVFSLRFMAAVGSLTLVLLGAGAIIWIFERKRNAGEFGQGKMLHGLGAGFWWSAVTMTTVGYGDKAPRTLGGRVVALIWMFMSLVVVASFTAAIAASLTANRLKEDRLRATPLDRLRIGVVGGTAAEDYAKGAGARLQTADTLDDVLTLLTNGKVDVVVHDAPLLKFVARDRFQDVLVDERILVRDDYGFAYPLGSPLRKPVNNAMLEMLAEPQWEAVQRRYLGPLPN